MKTLFTQCEEASGMGIGHNWQVKALQPLSVRDQVRARWECISLSVDDSFGEVDYD